jgi:hypothetical protein
VPGNAIPLLAQLTPLGPALGPLIAGTQAFAGLMGHDQDEVFFLAPFSDPATAKPHGFFLVPRDLWPVAMPKMVQSIFGSAVALAPGPIVEAFIPGLAKVTRPQVQKTFPKKASDAGDVTRQLAALGTGYALEQEGEDPAWAYWLYRGRPRPRADGSVPPGVQSLFFTTVDHLALWKQPQPLKAQAHPAWKATGFLISAAGPLLSQAGAAYDRAQAIWDVEYPKRVAELQAQQAAAVQLQKIVAQLLAGVQVSIAAATQQGEDPFAAAAAIVAQVGGALGLEAGAGVSSAPAPPIGSSTSPAAQASAEPSEGEGALLLAALGALALGALLVALAK